MRIAPLLPLLATLLVLTGCASPRTKLIARTGGEPLRPELKRVSLMPRLHGSPTERALDEQLAAELQRRGFDLVPPNESDFTISATAETNWDTHTETVYPEMGRSPAGVTAGPPFYLTSPSGLTPVRIEDHIQSQGIRLRLYDTRALKQGQFKTAWEGYVKAGFKLRPEKQRRLLQILCDYLGRDFIGHVKIGK